MARPPRIEFPGAVYHVASKGEAGAAVFHDDADRRALLAVMAQAMVRFDAQVLAYHLGQDGYELLVYTRQPNLSRLMRHLNGVYTQGCNRRRGSTGALFQGRFKAVLVDRDTMLLDVCRHVDMGAVRNGLARAPQGWAWSSYGAHVGAEPAPAWLDVQGLWSHLLGKPVAGAADRKRAALRYERLLASDGLPDIWHHLRQQIFLGDEAFAERMLRQAGLGGGRAPTPAKSQSLRSRPWRDWLRESGSRDAALYRAHTEGGLSMTALAHELGLSVSRVSRLIAGHERSQRAG